MSAALRGSVDPGAPWGRVLPISETLAFPPRTGLPAAPQRGRRSSKLLLAVGLVTLGSFCPAWCQAIQAGALPTHPRREKARTQMEDARNLKARIPSRIEQPEPWRAATLEAVAGYRAVRQHHPGATRLGAEASFRAGQLLAAVGEDGLAIHEYGEAKRLGGGTEFWARAGLEVGRLERRAGRTEAARAAYFEVATAASDEAGLARSGRFTHEAWLRLGDLWDEARAVEDARRAWTRVATAATDPRQRALAFDRLGLSSVREGDLEAAAGVLAECRAALRGICREQSSEGERARRALAAMRLVGELERAVGRRMRERQAARDSRGEVEGKRESARRETSAWRWETRFPFSTPRGSCEVPFDTSEGAQKRPWRGSSASRFRAPRTRVCIAATTIGAHSARARRAWVRSCGEAYGLGLDLPG